uniref:Globin domain-containing protein n=1 Tax=Gouania willdenowi TaxID=441366 RepID=A0A8C5I3N5_GOUWI
MHMVVSEACGELAEFTFIHCLTSWIPEVRPIESVDLQKTWDFLQGAIPVFTHQAPKDTSDPAQMHEPEKGVTDIVVCANYQAFQRENKSQVADSSQLLRRYGLSLLLNHVVLLTRTRSCPLEAPPKPPPVPRWKLIRPQNKNVATSEPQKCASPAPEHFIGFASAFVSDGADGTPEMLSSIGSALVSIAETPDSAPHAPDSPNSHEETQVTTAEDKKKDNDDISDDKHETSIKTSAVDKPILRETWVVLDDFAKLFQTLLVFHKPHVYPHNIKQSHFKSNVMSKTTQHGSGTSSSSSLHTGSPAIASPECLDVSGVYYLCVDGLQPSEVIVSFSALHPVGENETSLSARSAVFAALPHSWTCLQSHLPQILIKTASSKAAVLQLPAGRHVLRIHVRASLGYNFHLCCKTSFIFGDEESVMSHLTKEGARFTQQASSIFSALSALVTSFCDEEQQPALRKTLREAHCPQNITTVQDKWKHDKVFNAAVYHMFCKALDRDLTPQERFVVQALTADPLLFANEQSHAHADSKAPEKWTNRQPTDPETKAATVLQAGFKGHLVREVLNASKPGTEKNLLVFNTVSDMLANIEKEANNNAAFLLRYIVDNSEKKAELYPFQQDEWSTLTYADYSVTIPETANSWLLVFREVLIVPEEMLLVPNISCPLPNVLLRVINNDTGKELDLVCNKVPPHIYQPNKLGFTFVADVITPETPPVGAKWRMRLIGCKKKDLPKLSNGNQLSSFLAKEVRDYYIPKSNCLICRYCVQVTTDVVATIQFETSKSDVLVRLSVLDQEQEVTSNTGKGLVVLPVVFFLANNDTGPSDSEQKDQDGSPNKASPRESDDGDDGNAEKSSVSSSDHEQLSPSNTKVHKYMVQAEVLYQSWDLDEFSLSLIQSLQDLEKSEMKESKDADSKRSSTTASKSHDGHKSGAPKGSHKGKGKKGKEGAAALSKSGSKLQTSLDLTKPNWTLRVVTDTSQSESMEMKEDREREEEIKAMKETWETSEPGRAAKASESRSRFLNQEKEKAEKTESQDPDALKPDPSKTFTPNTDFSHYTR